MRSGVRILRILAALIVLIGSALLLASDTNHSYTARDKAFYADPNVVNFVRPGLVITITGASIAADGTAKVQFRLTDPKTQPLDRAGVSTPGAVSVSFILAYIPKGQTQYVSYMTRPQKSPITGVTENQASADSGGTYEDNGNGNYTYTFKTLVPKTYDPTVTHTVGAWGSRDLSEFDLGTSYDDTVYNFIPAGGTVTVVRDVIKTASCNNCHDTPMGFHGGPRQSMEVCVLCHTPQSKDPDTGNTVDMAVMIHKIHAGSSLPSVQAGKPYQIIGHGQSVNDYSEVVFPADVRSCTTCHQAGASQAANVNKANRAACGSCHDNVNFATGANHLSLPQVSDNQCTSCHTPKGETDFDASIYGSHLIPRFSTNLPGVVFELKSVTGAQPGASPTVSFTIKDKKGNPVSPSDLTRLNILLTGPNTDYALPGVAAGYVTESALKTAAGSNGNYTYTFTAKLPANASGSYTVAIEGRREVKLMPGTAQEILVRDTGANKQLAFAVDLQPVKARRVIVSNEKCNACHGSIAFHGDNRNDVMQCGICHNAGATGGTASIDFRTMVHRIHRGKELTRTYKIGNTSFNEVGYPGDLRDCNTCHVNNSQQLPLADGLQPVNDPSGYMTSVPPTTAACTSCHDTKSATAHSATNIDPKFGEACASCHGPNTDFSVNKVHAR